MTTLLCHAVAHRNIPVIEFLVRDKKANIGQQHSELGDETALHRACHAGFVDVIRVLLDLSVPFDFTHLKNARGERCFDSFSPLVDAGTITKIQTMCCGEIEGARSAIPEALQAEALECVMDPTKTSHLRTLLAEFGPTLANYVIQLEDDNSTLLLYSAARENNAAAIKTLLEYGANPDQQLQNLSTALHVACYRGYINCVAALLEHTPRPNMTLVNAYNELCDDVFREDVPLEVKQAIRRLTRANTVGMLDALRKDDLPGFMSTFHGDVNAPMLDTMGEKIILIHEASLYKSIGVMEFLLKNGATMGVDDAFRTACRQMHEPSVNLLLSFGAHASIVEDVIKENPSLAHFYEKLIPPRPLEEQVIALIRGDKRLPLNSALDPLADWIAQMGGPEEKISIEETGTPPSSKAGRAATVLWWACSLGNAKIARRLLAEFSASPTAVSQDAVRDTCLHMAAFQGHTDIVKMLLFEAKCDPNIENSEGITPGSVFDRSVSDAVTKDIADLIQRAREEKMAAEEAVKVKQYVESIPNRFIPGCMETTKRLQEEASELSKSGQPITLTAVRHLLSKTLDMALQEAAGVSAGEAAKNPVSSAFISALIRDLNAIRFTTHQGFDPLSVPVPGVFEGAVDVAAAAGKAVEDLKRAFFSPSGKIGTLFANARDAALQQRLNDVVTSCLNTLNVFKCCDIVFNSLVEMAMESIKAAFMSTTPGASAQVCGPVLRTFLNKLVLSPLKNDLESMVDLLEPNGPLLIVDRPSKVFASNLVKQRVIPFLTSLVDEWGTLDNYKDVSKSVCALYGAAGTGAAAASKKNNPRQLLEMADQACQKHIAERVEKICNDWLKKTITTPCNNNSTSQKFLDLCTSNAVKEAGKSLAALDQLLGPNQSLFFIGNNNFFEPSVLSKFFYVDAKSLHQFLSEVVDSHVANITKSNANNVQRFTRVAKSILDMITVPVTDVNQVISGVIRDVHLNTVWSKMAAYEKLDDVRNAITQSQVTLIEADTGSGKSVLIPQFICHEENFKTIVTQPRRDAALNTGQHVSIQYGQHAVGYQVAGLKNSCPKGPLQYYTDMFFLGQALAMESQDLQNVCVVIDEVHERNAPMDMLFMTLLEKQRSFPQVKMRIVLASATVDKLWFEVTTKTFGLSFAHVCLPVKVPFKVSIFHMPTIDPSIRMEPGPDTKNASHRESIAAKKALEIVKKDPKAKVVAFLPHKMEIEAAHKEFHKLCGGQVESHAMHATTQNAHAKLQTGRVFFSNNVLETTFTVPGLTHVLDFNHAIVVRVDPVLNTRELCIGYSTQSSYMQRKGRLGRLQDGEYHHFYDIKDLPASNPISFEQLPNDVMLQYEIRARFYLKKSLFKGLGAGGVIWPTLGEGLPVTPQRSPASDWLLNMSPHGGTADEKEALRIAAVLSLTGGFAVAFLHALKAKTCPLAILWLETIMECRSPFTEPGVPLPSRFASMGLGRYGDFGILIEIFALYLEEKQKHGPKFDIQGFCRPDKLTTHFLENVESRLEDVHKLLTKTLKMDPSTWKQKSNWSWDEIEDALMAGYWHQTVKLVGSSLQSGTYRSNDFQGPYRVLDSTQQHALSLFSNSAWVSAGPNPMPEFLLFHSLETIKGRSFVKMVCGVSQQSVKKFSPPSEIIQQSIGLVFQDVKAYMTLFQSIKTYANCTVTQKSSAQGAQAAAPPFTPEIQKRWGNGASNLHTEFVVKGNRLSVAATMDEIAADIVAARAHAKQVAHANSGGNAALNAQFCGAKPSATLQDLRQIDPKIAYRVNKATDPSRTIQDLKSCIQGTDSVEQGLAMCNVLLNKFSCTVKGGFVRDVVIRGLPTYKDFDIELPSSFTQQNWQQNMIHMSNTFRTDYGVICKPPQPFNHHGTAAMIRMETAAPLQVELECVSPWNLAYIPCKNMDFSVNNLRLQPNSTDVHQQVGFGMTVQQIVGQLRNSKPQASPLYDVQWVPGQGSNTGEGYTQKMWVEPSPSTSSMSGRLSWARKKGLWLVEASFHGSSSGSQSGQYTLYHGTSKTAAQAIVTSQLFKPSTGGNLGAGVYMSRDLTICKMFAQGSAGNVLKAVVDAGKIFNAHGWDSTGQQWSGYDSCLLEQQYSPRAPPLEEWAIRDPTRIKQITIFI